MAKLLWFSEWFLLALFLSNYYAAAWPEEALSLDLAWPELNGMGLITQSGGIVVGPDDDFPCASMPPEYANMPRTSFPLSGARPQYKLVNSTAMQARPADFTFQANVYFGHFSSDITANKSGWAYMTTDVFEGLSTGPQCGSELNLTQKLAYNPPPFLNLASPNLVGVNVTLGIRMVLFDGDNNYAESYQCSWLTLTSPDAPVTQSRGVCNSGGSNPPPAVATVTSSSSTSRPTSTLVTTTSASSISSTTTIVPVVSNAPSSTATNLPQHSHNSTIIPIAVAIPISAIALATVIISFLYIRRRRRSSSTRRKPTIALDFFVRGNPNEHSAPDDVFVVDDKKNAIMMTETKKKSDRDSLREAAGGSVHSEPLPVYSHEN